MITVKKTETLGLSLVKPRIFEDHRGTFVEIYEMDDYFRHDIRVTFVRDAISTSTKRVLRGIHYDNKTWKLIQCLSGRIYFVVVDMRADSATYLKWEAFVLTEHNRHQLLVPPRFGNGHLVLSDSCIFHYKLSEHYDPANERILRWDDPKANVYWPVKDPILSLKDSLGHDPNKTGSTS
jgi:dTDP-4-dehydrorhamnose 3,5-epimerase